MNDECELPKITGQCPYCTNKDGLFIDYEVCSFGRMHFVACDKCSACGPWCNTIAGAIIEFNNREIEE